jgi:hypothetical protein
MDDVPNNGGAIQVSTSEVYICGGSYGGFGKWYDSSR